LEKELAKVSEQRDGLLKRVAELEQTKPASKSRQQAEQALAMLKQGPVSHAQLKELNPKYPSDPIYYVRTMLKVDVKTVRTASGSVYMTAEHFQKYQEGLAEEKKRTEAAKAAAAKESLPQAPAQVISRAASTPAAARV
ncbi:MAG TPA: hypothetical protein VK466_03845, partial [Terriglobales bacterium]|nr:hypothetical protein [Terriglobales bacterium]